jgi:hypothetical protein
LIGELCEVFHKVWSKKIQALAGIERTGAADIGRLAGTGLKIAMSDGSALR